MSVAPHKMLKITVLLAFYTLAFIIFTYPLITDFGSCFISDGKDGCVFPWNIYNFREAVLRGQNPFVTDRIFYPTGSALVLHVYAPVTGLVGLFTPNCVLALNLSVLLSFIFSGLGAFLLAKRYLANDLLAAVAGFVFAYCPYKLVHVYGHYDLMLTASIPFFVLFMLRAFAWDPPEPGRRWAIPRIADRKSLMLALVFYALTFFSCYYYAYFLLIFVGLYALYFGLGLHSVRLFTRRNVVCALLIVAASTAVVGVLHFMGLDAEGPTRIGLGQTTDFLAFLVPSAFSRFLATDMVKQLRFQVIRANEMESTVYVGYAILVFIVAYLLKREYRRENPAAKMLSFMTAAFLVFATPILWVPSRIIGALPTALLHYVPFINNFRVPYRFDIMLMLFAPILGCIFLERYVVLRMPRAFRVALPALLVGLLFIEYWQMPYPVVCRRNVPAVYHRLSAMPDGTLLEIPFGLRDGFRMIGDERTVQMYYQTVHHKRILGGLVSRPDERLFERFGAEPVVGDLLRMEEAHLAGARGAEQSEVIEVSLDDYIAADIRTFIDRFALRYVVIYPDYRGGTIQEHLDKALGPFIIDREDIEGYLLLTLAATGETRETQP